MQQLLLPYIVAFAAVLISLEPLNILRGNVIKMFVEKIDRMQRSLDVKDIYNAAMIHELRNPLNAILGSIGLLRYSKNLNAEDTETLNIAGVSGEFLITLINNALDGAKLEAN